jgi:hypothetical protein
MTSQMNPFIAFCLYVAARVFVQYLKSKKDDTTVKSSLHFLLSAMQALKSKNPLTESFLVQLDVDLEGSGLSVPSNVSRYQSGGKRGPVSFPYTSIRGALTNGHSTRYRSTSTLSDALPCLRSENHKRLAKMGQLLQINRPYTTSIILLGTLPNLLVGRTRRAQICQVVHGLRRGLIWLKYLERGAMSSMEMRMVSLWIYLLMSLPEKRMSLGEPQIIQLLQPPPTKDRHTLHSRHLTSMTIHTLVIHHHHQLRCLQTLPPMHTFKTPNHTLSSLPKCQQGTKKVQVDYLVPFHSLRAGTTPQVDQPTQAPA